MGDGSSGEWSSGEIPYQSLATATDNFSQERLLGSGGFGPVYKGFLTDWGGREVAVKRLHHMSGQGMKQYAAEVEIITKMSHPHLVRLLGWCDHERDLMLVYEFMPHGSLDAHLFNGKSLLKWPDRYKIVLGLARALMHLHEECKPSVLHLDVKSGNVLLDSNFEAKLADFGLAMLFNHDMSSTQVSHAAGTRGYWAPEYALAAKASKRSDVYSFGVVVLEIACGQKAIRTGMAVGEDGEIGQRLLVEWVWELYGKGLITETVDPRLKGDFVREEAELLLKVGLWCAHPDHQRRPWMGQAIDALLRPETTRVPDLPAEMPPWAYSAAPVQMRMAQISSSSSSSPSASPPPPAPVSRISPPVVPISPPASRSRSGYGERAVDGPDGPSRSHKAPKRSIFDRFVSWMGLGSIRAEPSRKEGRDRHDNVVEMEEFAFRDLLRATNRFAAGNKVRQDGISAVYIGKLASGVDVEVKKFLYKGEDAAQVVSNYVAVLGRLSHENLLKPIGRCLSRGGEHLLVFEPMVNGTLARHLHYSDRGSRVLPWEVRHKVALGLASALHYLHDGWERCVLHRDIMPGNVLLDQDFNARLNGFHLARQGVAKHGDVHTTPVSRAAGTLGYMAPEVVMTGQYTTATDVYSFGIVALEMACGREPISFDGEFTGETNSIVDAVWKCHGDGLLLDAADRRLMGRFDRGQMERLLVVGLWCSRYDPDQRPPMARVLRVLRSEEGLPVFSRHHPDHVADPSGDDSTT